MANNINGVSMQREAWMSDAGWNSANVRRPEPPKKEMGSGTTLNYRMVNQTGACGVGCIYSFQELDLLDHTKSQAEYAKEKISKEYLHRASGGCGFLSAAFIDTPACKEMFLHLKSLFPILYQSDIRFNVNSGNNFFFCIFDTGEKEKPAEYTDPDHEDFDEDHQPGFPNGLEW